MAIAGGFLRLVKMLVYGLAFMIATFITGSFAWFIADGDDDTDNRAVLGLAAATMLYTVICVLLTCCLAYISFFASLSIIADMAFTGVMVAIAIITRDGVHGCDGNDRDGKGGSSWWRDFDDFSEDHRISACKLYVASFALSIVGAFLFLITIATQLGIRRRKTLPPVAKEVAISTAGKSNSSIL